MSDSYVPLVIAPATFTYQGDWACVETITPGVSFRKDEALAGYPLYDNINFTPTTVTFDRPWQSEGFKTGVVPFIIVADGSPIDIKITGSASVTFGGNSYQNDATSSAINERTFYRCPLPLTTTFMPLNPGLQFINVYSGGNSGGPPLDSGTTIKLTLLNHLRNDDDPCNVVLSKGSPCLTRGKTISGPTEVESMGKKEGNAGVYQTAVAEGPKGVRGAVGYALPGINSSILVIYFDAVKCRLLFVDHGTVIDSSIVDKVEAKGESLITGSLVLEHSGGSNFEAKATSNIMPDNLVEMRVSLTNVSLDFPPIPGPPDGGV
ncbi:hypothetical protein B0H14DRAFT_2678548, partial [Mycena olivaceomarginata]